MYVSIFEATLFNNNDFCPNLVLRFLCAVLRFQIGAVFNGFRFLWL